LLMKVGSPYWVWGDFLEGIARVCSVQRQHFSRVIRLRKREN